MKFDAKTLYAQLSALQAVAESGEAARWTPEEYSALAAAVALFRALETEMVFEALETVQALARVADLMVDDAPTPLVLQ